MHPSHKTQYFKTQAWPQEWVDEAIEMVHNEWAFFKAHFWIEPEGIALAKSTSSVKKRRCFTWDKDFDDEEGEALTLSMATAADPLELYLHSPVLVNISDPLLYWTSQNPSMNSLAQFALDFLSVPEEDDNADDNEEASDEDNGDSDGNDIVIMGGDNVNI
ncbi:uncharacterized protein ARMOST_16719 [Armillaria ostoyae]|uniref:HAT C-terminal dimerisation domain-containing protein n=1 Tax=Armillaria ostoyae TaxID=47428 RepID=A0A284RX13_ARMOS|nr:uncharacterized protein ARMOST_16719 [Armillaria ostoyae]